MNSKRNTLQKRIVSDIFFDMKNHPSAGMVYDEVNKKYPSISQATVYRILGELAKEGKINRIRLAGESDRFDFNLSRHSHAVCRKCGAVADVGVSISAEDVAKTAAPCEGFVIEECLVEFVGVCGKCRES